MSTQLRKERHSVSDLKIHLVCVTKYRQSIFTSKSLAVIEKSFSEVAKKMDFQVLEFNGETDHIHALIEFPPKFSVSSIGGAPLEILKKYIQNQSNPELESRPPLR